MSQKWDVPESQLLRWGMAQHIKICVLLQNVEIEVLKTEPVTSRQEIMRDCAELITRLGPQNAQIRESTCYHGGKQKTKYELIIAAQEDVLASVDEILLKEISENRYYVFDKSRKLYGLRDEHGNQISCLDAPEGYNFYPSPDALQQLRLSDLVIPGTELLRIERKHEEVKNNPSGDQLGTKDREKLESMIAAMAILISQKGHRYSHGQAPNAATIAEEIVALNIVDREKGTIEKTISSALRKYSKK